MTDSPTHLRISTRRGQRQSLWRAGLKFSRDPRDIAICDLGKSGVAAIEADPRLLIEPITVAAPPSRPADQAEALDDIVNAIHSLDKSVAEYWTGEGKPQAKALAKLLGWPVTAAERDTAWAQSRGPDK